MTTETGPRPYELEPITPENAVELYLQEKATEAAEWTLYSHGSRLGHFLRWCELETIDDLNTLTGRDMHRYKLWRRDDGDLNNVTLKTQMDTVRVFIRWCERIDAVRPDLHTSVVSPDLADGENERDVMIDRETTKAVLAWLGRYEYASAQHVCFALLWETAMRRGALRALDVDDYDPDSQLLSIHHRPDTDTPIKNQHKGERLIALTDDLCALLDDWIADQRPDITDDHGRAPLIATDQGRAHGQTIQKYVYMVTRPCTYGGAEACPEDRDPNECDALQVNHSASTCPASVSPHAVRRGALTHWLQRDVPMRVASDRANVSADVLDKHYDRRTERQKVEQRRRYLDQI